MTEEKAIKAYKTLRKWCKKSICGKCPFCYGESGPWVFLSGNTPATMPKIKAD